VSTESKSKRPKRGKAAATIAVIFEPIAAEAEAELVDRIARFLLILSQPEKQANQPHSLD
jgi:hypothetical protein